MESHTWVGMIEKLMKATNELLRVVQPERQFAEDPSARLFPPDELPLKVSESPKSLRS